MSQHKKIERKKELDRKRKIAQATGMTRESFLRKMTAASEYVFILKK